MIIPPVDNQDNDSCIMHESTNYAIEGLLTMAEPDMCTAPPRVTCKEIGMIPMCKLWSCLGKLDSKLQAAQLSHTSYRNANLAI